MQSGCPRANCAEPVHYLHSPPLNPCSRQPTSLLCKAQKLGFPSYLLSQESPARVGTGIRRAADQGNRREKLFAKMQCLRIMPGYPREADCRRESSGISARASATGLVEQQDLLLRRSTLQGPLFLALGTITSWSAFRWWRRCLLRQPWSLRQRLRTAPDASSPALTSLSSRTVM